jgi:hypothetical protein
VTNNVVNGYLSVDQLQSAVGDTTFGHIPEHIRAINAASRQIDMWAGRYFYQDAAPSSRLLDVVDRTKVYAGDFDSTSGVVVATDDTGDGTYSTVWTSDQWQAQSDSVPNMPFVRFNGWPWTCITTTTRSREFPVSGRRPNVRVTATWGWGSVPGAIEQACEALAILYYQAKDTSAGGIIDIDSVDRLSTDPLAVAGALVRPYSVPGGTLYVPPEPPVHLLAGRKLMPKVGKRR